MTNFQQFRLQFNPRADTQEKPGTRQFYNNHRNSSLLRGLSIGNTGLTMFITIIGNGGGGSTKKKKSGSGAAALGGANDSN